MYSIYSYPAVGLIGAETCG